MKILFNIVRQGEFSQEDAALVIFDSRIFMYRFCSSSR
jgi:hypothetical protein